MLNSDDLRSKNYKYRREAANPHNYKESNKMTEQVTLDEREDFEKWAKAHLTFPDKSYRKKGAAQMYDSIGLSFSWEGFQAAYNIIPSAVMEDLRVARRLLNDLSEIEERDSRTDPDYMVSDKYRAKVYSELEEIAQRLEKYGDGK